MDLSAETIWGASQAQLRSKLITETYNLWFAHLRARVFDGDRLVLEVPNEFCEIWLKDNYMGLLHEVVETASGRKLEIHFEAGTSEVPAEGVPPRPNASQQSSAKPVAEPTKAGQGLRFDPNNTFETFVVGGNNNFAHAAALAVAQSPGKAY